MRNDVRRNRPRRVRAGLRRRRLRTVWPAAALVVVAGLYASGLTPAVFGASVPGLLFGVTHTQYSADSWNDAGAVARAQGLLRQVAPVQNQNIMGWGAGNPEPRPGTYDFTSLDRRVRLITGTGGQPVLTLCCAPDWMKGGTPGSTDWSRITVAPTPAHYDDFARLAQRVAARYPQVHRFVVWNEMKGFYDPNANRWDAAAYTDLYNRVYRAVKAVRPDAQVGGPYVRMDSWGSRWAGGHPSAVRGPWGILDQRSLDVLQYWFDHSAGADFVAVDGGTATKDDGLVTSDFAATAKFSAVVAWLRAHTSLPIWWMELNAQSSDASAPPGDPRRAALLLDALVTLARAGASAALLWGPQAKPGRSEVALFSDTARPNGGQALPLAQLLQQFGDVLQEDPENIRTYWFPSRSLWVLLVPYRSVEWSAQSGLRVLSG